METNIIKLKIGSLARDKGFLEATEYYWDIKTQEVKRTPQGVYYNAFIWNTIKHTVSLPYECFLQEWLRKKHGIYAFVDWSTNEDVIVDYKNSEGSELHRESRDYQEGEDIDDLLEKALNFII